MLVEHARTLLGVHDAGHAESSADGTTIISLSACSLVGRTVEVTLTRGTCLAALHGDAKVLTESTTCSYGLASARRHVASSGGMVVSGTDGAGEVLAVERTDHPFFLATLYQPQLPSSSQDPHPVWLGFIEACSAAGAGGACAD